MMTIVDYPQIISFPEGNECRCAGCWFRCPCESTVERIHAHHAQSEVRLVLVVLNAMSGTVDKVANSQKQQLERLWAGATRSIGVSW